MLISLSRHGIEAASILPSGENRLIAEKGISKRDGFYFEALHSFVFVNIRHRRNQKFHFTSSFKLRLFTNSGIYIFPKVINL